MHNLKIVKVGNTALQRYHVTWLMSLNNMLILLIKALHSSLYLMVPTCHVIEKQTYIWVLLNVFHSVLFFLISFGMLSMSLEEKLFIQLWMNGQRPQWPDLYGNWFFLEHKAMALLTLSFLAFFAPHQNPIQCIALPILSEKCVPNM